VNIKSETRAECDQILLDEILKNLDTLPAGQQVMLKLSLPVQPGLFDPLVDHPKVLRVVALSGGYKRAEACIELAKNRGVIASFSRALLDDLRAQMSDAQFNASLGEAIDEIYQGSTQKTGACSLNCAYVGYGFARYDGSWGLKLLGSNAGVAVGADGAAGRVKAGGVPILVTSHSLTSGVIVRCGVLVAEHM